LIGQETDDKYLSYHFDYRGSTVALTDSSGQVTESFQYSPYGLLLSGDASKTPFLFNGMYGVMTDANNLYYMRARFYNPEIKRFINQDILLGSIGEGQTLNRYAFVTGKPISFVDPFGLEKVLTEKEVKDLFAQLAKLDLAFDNIKGGCEARTYFMIKKMQEWGYSPSKVWAFSNPFGKQISVKGREDEFAWWSFHVAPSIRGILGGIENDIVFDAGLFDEVATFEEWLDILNNEVHSVKTGPNEIPTRNLQW